MLLPEEHIQDLEHFSLWGAVTSHTFTNAFFYLHPFQWNTARDSYKLHQEYLKQGIMIAKKDN